MNKFTNVEVGNRVWDILYGWGTVTKVDKKYDKFTVEFDRLVWDIDVVHRLEKEYLMSGIVDGEYIARLYWNEIKFPSAEEDKCFNLKEYIKTTLGSKILMPKRITIPLY